jgi:hypothetical protein
VSGDDDNKKEVKKRNDTYENEEETRFNGWNTKLRGVGADTELPRLSSWTSQKESSSCQRWAHEHRSIGVNRDLEH